MFILSLPNRNKKGIVIFNHKEMLRNNKFNELNYLKNKWRIGLNIGGFFGNKETKTLKKSQYFFDFYLSSYKINNDCIYTHLCNSNFLQGFNLEEIKKEKIAENFDVNIVNFLTKYNLEKPIDLLVVMRNDPCKNLDKLLVEIERSYQDDFVVFIHCHLQKNSPEITIDKYNKIRNNFKNLFIKFYENKENNFSINQMNILYNLSKFSYNYVINEGPCKMIQESMLGGCIPLINNEMNGGFKKHYFDWNTGDVKIFLENFNKNFIENLYRNYDTDKVAKYAYKNFSFNKNIDKLRKILKIIYDDEEIKFVNLENIALKLPSHAKQKELELFYNRSSLSLDFFNNKDIINALNYYNLQEERIILFIPFYNYGNLLLDCLNSIKRQTFKNVIYVILNDGSEVENSKIAEKWIQKNKEKCIYYLKFNENRGVGFSKYFGMNFINSNFNNNDIVLIVDGDDYLTDKTILDKINTIYRQNSEVMWTIGGYEGVENFSFDLLLNFENKRNKNYQIPAPRSFRKSCLRNIIYQNFYIPEKGDFINKKSDKLLVWPITTRYNNNGVFINSKFYEYVKTDNSLCDLKNINKKIDEKTKDILYHSEIKFRNMIYKDGELGENIFLNNIRNKKIILVGNRPLDKDYSQYIDEHDIVIRFNLCLGDKRSGRKTDYLFVNNGIMKMLNGERWSKEFLFEKKTLNNVKKFYSKNHKNVIIRTQYYNREQFNNLEEKFTLINGLSNIYLNDYMLLLMLNKKYNLQIDERELENLFTNKRYLSVGAFLMFWLSLNNIEYKSIGFYELEDKEYIRSYQEQCKIKELDDKIYEITDHDMILEAKIRNKIQFL